MQIYAVVVVLALLPLALFIVAAHRLLVRQTEQKLLAQSQLSGKLVANLVEQSVTQNMVLCQSFALRRGLLADFEAQRWSEVEKTLEQAHSLRPDFLFFSVYDATGNLRAIYPPFPEALNKNYAHRDWFKGASQSKKPYLSEVYQAVAPKPWQVVAIAVPIKNANGLVEGYFAASQKTDIIVKEFQSLANPENNSAVSLVDQHGHVFGSARASVTLINSAQPINREVVRQVESHQAGSRFLDFNGRRMMVGFQPIPSLGWGVLLEVPAAAIPDYLWQYEKGLLILGLLVAVLAIGAGGFVASLYKKLRDAEIQSSFIIEKANDAFISMDSHGVITEWNPQAEKMFGWTRSEAIGKRVEDTVIPSDSRGNHRRGLTEFLKTGQSQILNKLIEITAIHRDGHQFPVELSISPIRQGKRHTFHAFLRDITARREADNGIKRLNEDLQRRSADLEQINRELEGFTYSVSHDLRAPIRHISGFSKILIDEFGQQLDPRASQYLSRIEQGSNRMALLVEDLLNLAKIGRSELHKQVAGLNSIVTEVVTDLQVEVGDRKIEWRIEQLPYLECDPALIRQVLYNLLANSVKFTRPRAVAVIEVRQEIIEGSPTIVVRDNGVGFSMKYADKLFAPFQRLHRGEEFEGTGIGLAIVQRIVTKHGGHVWCEAELDKGSSFYFVLDSQVSHSAQGSSQGAGS